MDREEITAGVIECVARVVDADAGAIRADSVIVKDLDADSLDLLDLVFQLEQRFKIRIEPKGIERRAREALGGEPLDVNGVYTPSAIAQLRGALPEIPVAELPDGLRTVDLPRRFRVATFANIVERLLKEKRDAER